MKASIYPTIVRRALISAALALGVSVHAAQVDKTAKTTHKGRVVAGAVVTTGGRSSASNGAVSLLDQAYGLLREADHDYKGHRARAMHNIEHAARELGAKLSGSGPGHEKQGTSDTQVRNAQSLLQKAIGGVTGKAHHHVLEAIKQLNTALNIK